MSSSTGSGSGTAPPTTTIPGSSAPSSSSSSPPPSSAELQTALSSITTLLDLLSQPPSTLNGDAIPSLSHVVPSLLSPLVPSRNTAATTLPDALALQMGLPPLSQAAQMENVKRYRDVVEASLTTLERMQHALQDGGQGDEAVRLVQRCMKMQGKEGEKRRVISVRKRRRAEDASRTAGLG
ncbi:uncharacterized protein PFL1_05628 [Pseudozyma flocculosa PF-1]|uniref:Uncharacterized protein n=2 Tax=Pseudozyma flocculosa TaxID=84751 RepID=A0A5C3FBF0_9BASI|nr:uncharacterized protein PFL1_05628 [Pseudozyma flocculosa PF-1]EPQ26992.1 hypothetical protein PFL1_05628 [Pseudozyma flocculosa PF-1]SPO40679.1 uncharacterized protein PSFLO_06161 [Pseudozyma flocculosa]